jgi:23S rRNA A2030 N6-methylase RlmJ
LPDQHSYRVGNRGDVWKHFILCGVVDTLLQGHADNQPFVYADTHCSLGHFILNENGQWRQGIGRFYENDFPLAKYTYFVIERTAYKADKSYLGSWKLVEKLLAVRKIQGDLKLFDTCPEVAGQLSKVSGFKNSDGFEAIMSNFSAELYFVDPAYSEHRERDWKRVTEIIKQFCEQNAKALIWYPVFCKKRPIEDLAGVVIAEVRWPARGANQVMRGCGMVATGSVSGILHEMQNSLAQLAEALSGNLCLRDQRA